MTEPNFVRNQADLAKALGVSRKTIQRYLALEGHPETKPDGRYPVDEWRAFAASIASTGEPMSRLEAKTQQILLQNQKLEHQISVLKRDYVAASDVEERVALMIIQAKNVLEPGPSSLAPQVVGLSITEAETLLKTWVHDCLSRLHKDPLGRGIVS